MSIKLRSTLPLALLFALIAAFAPNTAVAANSKPDKPASIPGTVVAADFAETASPADAGVELASGKAIMFKANVASAGMYTIELRTSHLVGDDPLFIVTCDGRDISGTMNAPYTITRDNWTSLFRPAVNLTAGEHEFTVKHTGGTGFFLQSLKFTPGGVPKPGPKPDASAWELVWSDEFDKDGAPNPDKWAYDIGGHGWGNNELQYYTDRRENSRVENGHLVIEARKEDFDKNHYTSARLLTRGKKDFKYGRFEVSAKLPTGLGTWPAIWLLGSNGKPWPANGELDIMEHLGRNAGWIHGSGHCQKYYFKNGNQKTSITYVPDAEKAFHEYALEWYPDHIDFFVDNNKYLTVTNEGSGWEAWPFDDPEHMILNVALGGWGGEVTDAHLPARMEVDYVRVYKHK